MTENMSERMKKWSREGKERDRRKRMRRKEEASNWRSNLDINDHLM